MFHFHFILRNNEPNLPIKEKQYIFFSNMWIKFDTRGVQIHLQIKCSLMVYHQMVIYVYLYLFFHILNRYYNQKIAPFNY